MKKALLIDDESSKGWGLVLKAILEKQLGDIHLDSSSTVAEAKTYLEDCEYDLIFLDIRLSEADHGDKKPSDFSSFHLLTEIRNTNAINFTTPIILFTASNKIWNIDYYLNAGADGYYIKEHPQFSQDDEFAKENYKRLITNISNAVVLKDKRNEIWKNVIEIEKNLTSNITSKNRQERIRDKLKVGYGILNRKTTEFEKSTLLFSQEILAYLVFWSILDEIAFDYILMDYSKNPKSAEVKIKGVSGFVIEDNIIEKTDQNRIKRYVKTNFKKNNAFKYDSDDDRSYSEQLSSFRRKAMEMTTMNKISIILNLKKEWKSWKINSYFKKPFSNYRNSIDYIHPSHEASTKRSIAVNKDNKKAFDKSVDLLKFIHEVLLE